ncbi:MAG: amino acid ABC transporter substrate-binding protein [Candidatus Dadabacteria bacterium]|nr:MAG: amino acid ABC transporter substrate-binding protein [Candidatus Dadabacteria bacterium]
MSDCIFSLSRNYIKKIIFIFSAFFFLPIVKAENITPIKIGAIFILSGEGSAWGINAQRGTILAVEEINSSGGIRGRPIEVIYEDEPGGSAVKAVEAYHKLTKIDKVKYILGPSWQDEVMAVAPLSKRDKVIVVGATYMPNPPENMFMVWMDAEIEADRIVDYVIDRFHKVAVLSSQQSWESLVAKRFKKSFESRGGKVAAFFEPLPSATDVKAEALKTKAASPDAIFISSYLLFSKYTRELRRLGVKAPFFSQELDQTAVDSSGKAAEGTIFIRPAQPDNDFLEKFRKRFGTDPDIPAAQSYDALYVLARALKSVGEDYGRLVEHFKNFPAYRGVCGTYRLQGGKTITDTELMVIKNGAIRKLKILN